MCEIQTRDKKNGGGEPTEVTSSMKDENMIIKLTAPKHWSKYKSFSWVSEW